MHSKSGRLILSNRQNTPRLGGGYSAGKIDKKGKKG